MDVEELMSIQKSEVKQNTIKDRSSKMVGFMSVLVSNNVYDQKNLEICYAIAIATLIRAAESHIYGRKIEPH